MQSQQFMNDIYVSFRVSFTSLKFFLGLTHFAHYEDTKKYPEWSFSFLSPKSISY